MSHYFINDKNLQSKPRIICYQINGKTFELVSDLGVFSKNELDEGSKLLIECVLKNPDYQTILDMGCGYGPIGITLATFLCFSKLDMVDINLRSIELAKKNIVLNALANCQAFYSDCFSSIVSKYDLILINPPIRAGKAIIYKMFEQSRDFLNNNGKLMIVIRKDQGGPSAKKKIEEIYGNCELVARKKGFFVFVANKNTKTLDSTK